MYLFYEKSHDNCRTPGKCVTLWPFSVFLRVSFHYIQFIFVTVQLWHNHLFFLLNIDCLSHSIVSAFSSPLTTLVSTSACTQRPASRRSRFWQLSTFAFFLLTQHLPANTSTERVKRQPFFCILKPMTLKSSLAHRSWLHSFPNANQMWSTNVWQRFFFLQKTDVGQKCSDIKINCQRNIVECNDLARLVGTDEMWQSHFQLCIKKIPARGVFLANTSLRLSVPSVRLWQMYVLNITKHTSAQDVQCLCLFFVHIITMSNPFNNRVQKVWLQFFQASCSSPIAFV